MRWKAVVKTTTKGFRRRTCAIRLVTVAAPSEGRARATVVQITGGEILPSHRRWLPKWEADPLP